MLLDSSVSNPVKLVTPLANGGYIIAGQFDALINKNFYRIVKLSSDAKADTTFNNNTSTNGQISSIISLRDGRYMVVGDFTMI